MAAEQTIHLDRYAPDAKALVAGAQSLADERKHAQVEPLHLLARAIERDRGVQEVFKRAGADPADVSVEAESQLARINKTTGGLAYLSNAMLQLLARAEKEAAAGTVEVDHLLNSLSQELRGSAAVVLQAFGLGPGSFRPHMSALRSVPREVTPSAPSAGDVLSRFTHDLVERARREGFDPVIGRDVEVRRLLQILERRQKNHPLLVGEAGVGKTAIVGALAMRIAAGDVPESLAKLSILELETGLLVAGAKLRGEIEERLRQVLAAVKQGTKETLLYVNGIDSLLGQGAAGSGVGDLLKPLLSRNEMRLIASTTVDGAKKMQERDPGLLRRFSVLTIDQPTLDQAIEILRGIASKYEAHHQVQIGEGAIVAAVRLAKRYVQDRALPDTAIDLLDETAARKRVEIDGVPAKVDEAIRRLASLKAQAASLAGDADAMSVKTRERLEKETRELEPTVSEMRAKLDSRRGAMAAFASLRAEETRLEAQLEEAREKHDFARLGELEHVQLPDVKRRLEAAKAAVGREAGPSASNIVTEEDVAVVLGDWTGIPVSKMLEAESEKLLKMEERLAERVVGQDEAVRAVSRAVRRGRVGLRDPGKPIGSFLFLGPSGVGQDRARQGARGVPVRRRAVDDPPRHERVHGEAHGAAPRRRAARLRRQRGGRLPHRGRPPAPVQRAPLRRGREGARRRLQPAAPGARRRAPDRRPRAHGELLEHRRHHDEQHRQQAHPRDRSEALRDRRGRARRCATSCARSCALPAARVPEPHRRRRPLPPSLEDGPARHRRHPAPPPREAARATASSSSSSPRRRRTSSSSSATSRPSARARCSARS